MAEIHQIEIPPTLSVASLSALHEAIERVDGGIGVLRAPQGADCFCRGMDFDEMRKLGDRKRSEGSRAFADLMFRLRCGLGTFVAVVESEAIGGGLGIAAACDIAIASEEARFSLPEALYGFAPYIVAAILPGRVPAQVGRHMALSCETIGAAEAYRCGLVDILSDKEGLEKVVKRTLRQLGRTAQSGRAAAKRAFAESGLRGRLDAAVDVLEADLKNPVVLRRVEMMADGLAPWLGDGLE